MLEAEVFTINGGRVASEHDHEVEQNTPGNTPPGEPAASSDGLVIMPFFGGALVNNGGAPLNLQEYCGGY